MFSKHIFCPLLIAGLAAAIPQAQAERITFASRSTWQEWAVPTGAIAISPLGNISPIKIRKNIDAIADAGDFGGGIQAVGSGANSAAQILDGDLTTGWQPDPSDPNDSWWVEIDLGRMVTAEKIRIHFAADAPAMEFFTVQLSSGEQFFTNALVPIPGTLVYGGG